MRARRPTVVLLVLLASAAPLSAYTLVRKGGRKMEIREAPRFQDGTAYFTFKNGLFGFLPEEDVDRAATERANARGAARRSKKPSKPAAPEPPKVYTNDDLAHAVGLANVEGTVTAEGKPVPPPVVASASPLPPAAATPPAATPAADPAALAPP